MKEKEEGFVPFLFVFKKKKSQKKVIYHIIIKEECLALACNLAPWSV